MYTKLRDSFYKKHRMIRSTVFTRGPIFLSLFPFNNVNHYDKPANEISTPLTDELGWDRVKRIFSKTYVFYHIGKLSVFCLNYILSKSKI